ncbi:hypothetical protein [Paenibacillus sp. 1P07SE]|uniref:hypothetical protein n=1 Tax=Paenibacillus sp. 1P07SE TaxID=3132209 RepID=UPI0039A4E08D
MQLSGIALLLMSLIPGLGHYMIQRRVRAFLYPFLVIGGLGIGFVLSIMMGSGEPFLFMGLVAFGIWAINILDMMWYLLVRPSPGAAVPPHPGGGMYRESGPAYGPAHGPAGGYEGAAYGGSVPYAPGYDPNRRNASERFYTILLSAVPGLAHFQLGLMQRGLTLLLGFFGLASVILFMSAMASERFILFLVVLPIIWLYGLFDAVRQLERKQLGEPLQDRSILEDWDAQRAGGRRSRLLTTLLAVIPGAGHMYLGAQQRGLQLMGAFLLSFYLLDVLYLTFFMFLVPVIWCFAFFDALQLGARYERMEGFIEDVPIVSGLSGSRRWLGAGMILLAGYIVFNQFIYHWLVDLFGSNQFWVREMQRYVQIGVITLLLFGGGLKLMLGGARRSGV